MVLVKISPEDAALITRVFQETKAWNHLVHFDDCQNALTHLQSQPAGESTLILLAMKASDRSALQFLEALKEDETLRMIPVVVLARSNEEGDVSASFALGGVGYMIKSADASSLHEQTAAILAYWSLSQLPRIR